jgi:hypothetical protein
MVGGPDDVGAAGVETDGDSPIADGCGAGVPEHPLTSNKTQIDAYASIRRRFTQAAYVRAEHA